MELGCAAVAKQSKRERQRENREARRAYELQMQRRQRMWRIARIVAIVLIPLIAIGVIVAVTSGGDDSSAASPAVKAGCRDAKAPKPKDTTFPSAPPLAIDTTKSYTATVDTSCGSFEIALDAAAAPQTVNSFIYLVNQGFYDGLDFHRVAKDFVIQGGDPQGDGSGGPGYTLPDEPPPNGYQKGSVAMANSGANTSGSQLFIVTSDQGAANLGGPPYLYSILGQVTDGIDTVERINTLGSSAQDAASQVPRAPVVIDKITVAETPPVPVS